MKFDREIVIGILVCGIILFGWGPFARKMGWMPAENAPVEERSQTPQTAPADAAPVQPAPTAAVPAAPVRPAAAAASPAPAESAAAPAKALPAQDLPVAPRRADVFLENDDIKVTIDPNAGAVTSVLLKKYDRATPPQKPEGWFAVAKHDSKRTPVAIDLVSKDVASGALNLVPAAADNSWRLLPRDVSVSGDGKDAVLVGRLMHVSGAEFTVTQRWTIGRNGYKIGYKVDLRNSGRTTLYLPALQVGGGALGSVRELSGDDVRGDSHYLDYLTAANDYNDISATKKDDAFFGGSPVVRWAAVGNKYFCAVLNSNTPYKLERRRAGSLGDPNSIVIAASLAISDGSAQIPADGTANYAFDYYCGPKILRNLTDFEPSTAKVMHLSSLGPLNYLARGMLWILVKLHALLGSYGLGIILLTLLVRLIFYPITARGNASMKKMQAVQPKLKELRKRYKDNPQLMNAKMMELYRQEGVNPFGGCLPILLQIPVFFALYCTFEGAVELRQSSFLWCHNLAAADTVAFVFGQPINPLVLAMTALMVLQQYMTPMSMEPAQRKMMLAMPVVMLFFFYNLPSGLTLYWTVSNIFSIVQLRLQQRGGKTTAAAGAAQN